MLACTLLLMACERVERPVAVQAAPHAYLLRSLPFATLSLEVPLPYGPWSGPVEVPVEGWELLREDATSRSYVAHLPELVPGDAGLVDTRAAGGKLVERRRSDLRSGKGESASSEGTWSLNGREEVELSIPKELPPPNDSSHRVVFNAVTKRERSWIFDGGASMPVDDFVRRQVEVAKTTRSGLLLPAPARVSWRIEVPPSAELSFAAGLLPPEWKHLPLSNGGTLSVEVATGAGGVAPREVYRAHIRDAAFEPTRISLAEFAGQTVELSFTTDPVGSSLRDYLFVAEPVVASRLAAPRRAVVLFVDTLRPDRLGMYGHDRDTSPRLDQLAARGALFERGRSVAPWTLPAVRSLLTGRAPEAFDRSETLPALFSAAGFSTALFGANNYLMPNFGTQRDWDMHTVTSQASATFQTELALEWLSAHDGRDALLVVHYMDPHLPYVEPEAYRNRFDDSPAPSELKAGEGAYLRRDVLAAAKEMQGERRAALTEHLLGRYDANIRYVDDEIARLLAALSPDDFVVLVSDHGEEFFDHGSFEHGHTFGESVMRIPLVFAGRGVRQGRYARDVSILDVMPTLADAFGLVVPEAEGDDRAGGDAGRSLWPLLQSGLEPGYEPGSESRAEKAEGRRIAFGRPLYGPAGWGMVAGDEKYVVRGGLERRSRVSAKALHEGAVRSRSLDPTLDEPMRDLLPTVLRREFVWAWRLAVNGVEDWPPKDVSRTFAFEGGVVDAWVGGDPTLRSSALLHRGSSPNDPIEITWRAGYRGASEVFVVAPGPPRLRSGSEARPFAAGESEQLDETGRSLSLSHAWIARPLDGETALVADDPELRAQLRALGYLVGEDEESAPVSPE